MFKKNPEEDSKTSYPHSRVKRYSTFLVIRNHVLSIWQTLEAKMLSSMSYTPPEVFAYNLTSKLKSLRSTVQAATMKPRQMSCNAATVVTTSNRLRYILENHNAAEYSIGPTIGEDTVATLKTLEKTLKNKRWRKLPFFINP